MEPITANSSRGMTVQEAITLTAELRLTPTTELGSGAKAIQQFCLDMQSEAGCNFAVAMQDGEDPRRFILWEQYRDTAAQQAHFNANHTQAFIAANIAELVAVTEGRLLTAVAAGWAGESAELPTNTAAEQQS